MWKSGDWVARRNIYRGRIWDVQPAIVVKDTRDEVALAVFPGAECKVPRGYTSGKSGNWRMWDRKDTEWELESFIWHTNRLLILLEPQRYYSIIHFWQHGSNRFGCFYINFELPFQRSRCGFDTLDLELDLLIKPDFSYEWKDLDEYQKGIDSGIILKEWMNETDRAKNEVLERLHKRQYPFDNSWLDWYPDPSWSVPKLPADWDKV
ncbi:MAG TPA: DUF402 domain-containing protein [Anaerolineales bacterium]|nr:DUF402 domain-containing protein [Anaerolineales bacterium]